MAVRVFFLNKLREGVDPAEYERWVREVDYPLARGLPTIRRYDVARLEGMLQGDGDPPCDYLEVVDISDLDEYRASLSGGAEIEAFFEEWSSFVGESVAVHGEVIE
jgi:hypothetical protein